MQDPFDPQTWLHLSTQFQFKWTIYRAMFFLETEPFLVNQRSTNANYTLFHHEDGEICKFTRTDKLPEWLQGILNSTVKAVNRHHLLLSNI